MPKPTVESNKPFLIQIYFVLATLLGLILLMIGSVNLAQLALKSILGVKQYPEFRAPYPSMEKYPGQEQLDKEALTEEQRQKIAEWEQQYDQWQKDLESFNSEDQNTRREIATALAMLVVGIPVFAIHAPHVFRKK